MTKQQGLIQDVRKAPRYILNKLKGASHQNTLKR